MLSTEHRQFPPVFSLLSPGLKLGSNGQPNPQRIQTSGLDSFANGSRYALQHIQSMSMAGQNVTPALKSPICSRHRPYESAHNKVKENRGKDGDLKRDGKTATTAPIRRRISRACDQCNQLRTKCDGRSPCAHCVEFGLACEYFRERKKRGKASRKDLAQQAAATSASGNLTSPSGYSSEGPSPTQSMHDNSEPFKVEPSSAAEDHPLSIPRKSTSMSENSAGGSTSMNGHLEIVRARSMSMNQDMSIRPTKQPYLQLSCLNAGTPSDSNSSQVSSSQTGSGFTSTSLDRFSLMNDYSRSGLHTVPFMSAPPLTQPVGPHGSMSDHISGTFSSSNSYPTSYDGAYSFIGPQDPHQPTSFPFSRTSESPTSNFMAPSSIAGSPGWLSLPSPSAGMFAPQSILNLPNTLRYPVLQPLLPSIANIIPTSLACDLLELYFTSSSSAHMHPISPYLLAYVFRKRSVLHPSRARACSPALLCSMLWVAAQTSDAPFLTSPPAARARICEKLLELVVGLLRPLIHGASSLDTSPNYSMNTTVSGLALGGLGVATASGDRSSTEGGGTGTLDDVATYFHLATVVSASEYKAASLRWWNAAWSLARELKFGRELPPNPLEPGARDQTQGEDADADGDVDLDVADQNGTNSVSHNSGSTIGSNQPGAVNEEEREERRRIWWLLYTVDRHLALCYNRPLFLLDIECDGLLQPMNDTLWQNGDFYGAGSSMFSDNKPDQQHRRRGPSFECTGHSVFGSFLPLMTILGEIVDLNQARNHPRFGLGFRGGEEWNDQTAEITQQLEGYGRSLKEFETRYTASMHIPASQKEGANSNNEASSPSVHLHNSTASRMTELAFQTKIVVAYGTHVMHVLHVLLAGKWDPISLLDDNDLWISSQSFVTATGHAVSAAEAINDILEYDPDLSFMPFFFGIYLLQGSFLLLLIADKLQGEASANVVKACETIVRAHEACVATLSTEYQRNFRKVMRSALAQVKGRIPEDFGEQQLRRREVLALYRWTGDGTGLAL